LPDGLLAWDDLTKSVDAAADQSQAHFTFHLTNISSVNVAVLNVHPSCGCTTAQLPPLPWILAPGTNGQINITVNLAGKSGTLFKTVNITTDKGNKTLMLRINILPRPIPSAMTEAERAHGLAAAKADRQAVFKNDCATCHVKPGEGKYGQALYTAVCAICHEAEHRATMVADLHTLKTPTNEDFWRTWIAHGKPGSLMPAFSTAEGGPLNDMQIASLAAYLNAAIPSRAAPPPQ
jgi:mono/diheme cytochrome c family protein